MFELLGVHFDVVLGIAQRSMLRKERAVPALQDVQVGVGEVGIVVHVEGTVLVPNEFGHDGRAVRRILAVQNQRRARFGTGEQLRGQKLLVVVVDRSVDVTPLVLVLEPAVDHHDVVEPVVVLAVHHLHQGTLADPRERIGLILRDDMWQLLARGTIDIADRL